MEHRPFSVVLQPIFAITKIPVLLIVVYYFLNFAWVISVNTTISIWLTNFYGFNPKNLGEPACFLSSHNMSLPRLISALQGSSISSGLWA